MQESESEVDEKYMNLTKSELLLLENLSPIHTLTERLSRPNNLLAQGKLPEYDLFQSNARVKIADREYVIKDGLITNSMNGNLLIPKELEGITLSHAHLSCGHIEWNKLYSYMRSKYDFFSHLNEKCRNMATLCHVCYVSNPSTHRKTPLHSKVASYPHEIVTADLLEVISDRKEIP